MEESKLKSYLEIATNVAVILVALVILTVVVSNYFRYDQRPQTQPGLQKGQLLKHLPIALSDKGIRTLLVLMSTTCPYCTESVPFYNQLDEARLRVNGSTDIVAIFPNPEYEVGEYARRVQLKLPTLN